MSNGGVLEKYGFVLSWYVIYKISKIETAKRTEEILQSLEEEQYFFLNALAVFL